MCRLARTRVKICGISREQDARAAAAAGADAIGFVFHEPSPRAVDAGLAAAICEQLPPFVTTVGLFVDPTAAAVRAVLQRVPLDLLQFHGEEPQSFCGGFGRPWIKALRMRPEARLETALGQHDRARALLVDSYRPGVPGGTGQTFDWGRLPPALAPRLVLAGGLNADNVAAAVQRVRPWAVDVSGGVEVAPGIKCPDRIEAFVAAVRWADADNERTVE